MPFDDELPQREPFKHWSVRRVAGTGRRERDAPMSRPVYWTDSFEPATRLLPDVRPRAGTVVRALLAVTAGVRAPLLSLTARAADVSLRLRHRGGYLPARGRRQARRREALPRRTVSCEGPPVRDRFRSTLKRAWSRD